MSSGSPMALSERPQHAAPGPLYTLYMESLNSWWHSIGIWVCASNGTVCEVPTRGFGPPIGIVREIRKGPVWASHVILCEAQAHGSEAP